MTTSPAACFFAEDTDGRCLIRATALLSLVSPPLSDSPLCRRAGRLASKPELDAELREPSQHFRSSARDTNSNREADGRAERWTSWTASHSGAGLSAPALVMSE